MTSSWLGERNPRLHVDVVICHDFPNSVLLRNHLQQSGADAPFVIPRYTFRGLGGTIYRCHGFKNGNVGSYEFEGRYVLLQRRILEDPSKDHFMLFQIARVACEELASDVRERSRAGEVARVANRVTFIPGLKSHF
jgi:hypothetical protein